MSLVSLSFYISYGTERVLLRDAAGGRRACVLLYKGLWSMYRVAGVFSRGTQSFVHRDQQSSWGALALAVFVWQIAAGGPDLVLQGAVPPATQRKATAGGGTSARRRFPSSLRRRAVDLCLP